MANGAKIAGELLVGQFLVNSGTLCQSCGIRAYSIFLAALLGGNGAARLARHLQLAAWRQLAAYVGRGY